MYDTKSRTRIVNRYEAYNGLESILFPFFNSSSKIVGSLHSTQTTRSTGHPFKRLGKTDVDIGGEFFSSICTHKHNCPYIEVWSGGTGDSSFYKGPIFPYLNRSEYSLEQNFPCQQSSFDAINAAGTEAIAKVIPTNPVAGLAVTFGELMREGLPRIIGSELLRRGKPPKKIGNEYLNWEFGWKPLIADFKKWLHAYRRADRLWDQFVRDSGRRVRRRYTFPKSVEILESSVSTVFPAVDGMLTLDFWQGGEHLYPLHHELKQTRRRWFSGCFTYFLDDQQKQQGHWKQQLRRLDYLYGVKITPEVLWNLAPWTWAVDWLTNTGDIITNLTRFSQDGLVMPYGYMMETTINEHTYRMRDVKPKGYHIRDLTQTFTHTVKYRRGATPFGFGLDEGAFTPRQWAIIAALGLSRSR